MNNEYTDNEYKIDILSMLTNNDIDNFDEHIKDKLLYNIVFIMNNFISSTIEKYLKNYSELEKSINSLIINYSFENINKVKKNIDKNIDKYNIIIKEKLNSNNIINEKDNLIKNSNNDFKITIKSVNKTYKESEQRINRIFINNFNNINENVEFNIELIQKIQKLLNANINVIERNLKSELECKYNYIKDNINMNCKYIGYRIAEDILKNYLI